MVVVTLEKHRAPGLVRFSSGDRPAQNDIAERVVRHQAIGTQIPSIGRSNIHAMDSAPEGAVLGEGLIKQFCVRINRQPPVIGDETGSRSERQGPTECPKAVTVAA